MQWTDNCEELTSGVYSRYYEREDAKKEPRKEEE